MNGLANAPCEQGILVGQVEQLSIHVYTSNQQTKYQIRHLNVFEFKLPSNLG